MTTALIKDAGGNQQTVTLTVPGVAGTPSVDFVSVQGGAGATPVITSGSTKVITCGITRPANVTPYSAGQCVSDNSGAALFISTIGRISAGTGIISNGELIITSNPTVKPDLALLIFQSTLNMGSDGASIGITQSQLLTHRGTLRFSGANTTVINGMTLYDAVQSNIQFVCGAGSQNLFGYIITLSAWTPGSADIVRFNLGVQQD